MEQVIKLFKEDLLKGVHTLLQESQDWSRTTAPAVPISVGLILLLATDLALLRALYGTAEYGITQHFVATFSILLASYILGGTALIVSGLTTLAKINRYAATVFMCLLTASLLYLLAIVIFGFFTNQLLSWIDHKLPVEIRDSNLVLIIEDWVPALIFSVLGCWLVLVYNNKHKHNLIRYSSCFIVTTAIFYYAVFQRDGFFDYMMKLVSNISL